MSSFFQKIVKLFSYDIGIDLGTANTLVNVKDQGIVLREPSVVAVKGDKVLAVGDEAKRMLGRTPGNIVAIRPLREGVISDYDMTERMLKEFIKKVTTFSLFKPRLLICVPSGITQAIFSMAMVIVQSLTNSFGEMVIAANVIIMRVDGFAMMPNFSFGTAMTTYAGQNVGAHRMDRVEQGARQGTAIALGTSAVITLLILVFGKNLMAIFTDTSELVTLSANMMKILAVGYLAMAITQSLSGVMRGAGDTMTPMWISMITTVVIRVPLAYGLAFLTRTPELPNGRYQVLWISLLVCWCMGALLTFLFYKKGNWKKKALTANTNA